MLKESSPDQDNDTNYSPLTTAATLITFQPVLVLVPVFSPIRDHHLFRKYGEEFSDHTTVTLDISSLYLQDTDQAAHGSE